MSAIFKCMSAKDALNISKNNKYKCVIISITDKDSDSLIFDVDTENSIISTMDIKFDDELKGEKNCMTLLDAEKILDYVKAYYLSVDYIIIHCNAGISRSAGICAALMKIYNGDDYEIFNNPTKCPNMHCYRMIMEAHYGHYYQDDVSIAKLNHNIDIWKELNEI